MRKLLMLAALPLLVAANGNMSLTAFLAKADKLQAMGPMALVTGRGDIDILVGEMKAASERNKAEIKAAKAAGKPIACPPEKPQGMDQNALLSHFRSYPVARRSKVSVKTALLDLTKKKYPCPKK